MTRPSPKQRLNREFARLGKAVSNPGRLELLALLAQGEKPVQILAEGSGLSAKNTSAHLRTLRDARLVETRREGTYVYYRIAAPEVFHFLGCLQKLGHARLAEVERVAEEYYADPDGLEPVGPDALLERVRLAEVTVLDVRPADEYEAGHVPGARSVPLAELERRLEEIPRDREVVAYCRGPYCMLSVDAVELLRTRGFQARLMKEGVPEWRAAGRAVETGPA